MNLVDWSMGLDTSQWGSGQAVGMIVVWMMVAMAVLGVIFAFLVLRQAQQMATVLPTPITPAVKIIAWLYLLLTALVLAQIIFVAIWVE